MAPCRDCLKSWFRTSLPTSFLLVLLSFVLFGAACGLSKQVVWTLDVNLSDVIPHMQANDGLQMHQVLPSTLTHFFPSASSHPLFSSLSSSASSSPSVGAFVPPSGSIHVGLYLGFYRFCYEFSVDVLGQSSGQRPGSATPNMTHVDFSTSACSIIDSKCAVDATQLMYDIAAMNGVVPPQEAVDIAKNFVILDQCDVFNASRAFSALACIVGGVTLILVFLLWRKMVPLISTFFSTLLSFICALIALSLLVSVEQNDARISLLTSSPILNLFSSLRFGLAFALLVVGTFFALLSSCGTARETWRRTEGGTTNPFTLQENPESGILESHVSMYQQM